MDQQEKEPALKITTGSNRVSPYHLVGSRLHKEWSNIKFSEYSITDLVLMHDWLDKTCKGYYSINLVGVYFQNQEDLFAFTLRWGHYIKDTLYEKEKTKD